MSALKVVGVDPGPIPGIVVLRPWDNGEVEPYAIQCTHNAASDLVDHLLRPSDYIDEPMLLAVEKFVIGRKSMTSGRDGGLTRDLVGQLQRVAKGWRHVTYVERPAAAVKPWATDERLARAGLLEPTKGMRHARDAARHALFAAVKDGGLPDPLSTRKDWS